MPTPSRPWTGRPRGPLAAAPSGPSPRKTVLLRRLAFSSSPRKIVLFGRLAFWADPSFRL